MFSYEKKQQKLLPRRKFVRRLLSNLAIVLGLIGTSLFGGMLGYHLLEGLDWLDSFLEAAMIIGGMGPVSTLHGWGAKFFAGSYAIYCGLLLIAASGLLLAPVFHRVMHNLHMAEEDDEKRQKKK